MNDLNPFVRRTAYAGLLKLRKNTEFGATQDYVPEDDVSESDEEEDQPSDDLCLKLLRNTMHNLSEEEQKFGGQSIKPEQDENILAIAIYLLDQVLDDNCSAEIKYKTMHPIYFMVLEKLDEIDQIFLCQIIPVLIRYTKRYLGRQIDKCRDHEEEAHVGKELEKVLECILVSMST